MKTYTTSLEDLAGVSNVVFRFVFHSDQSINQEGVVLDNIIVSGKDTASLKKEELEYSVYPNPSMGIFNIDWKMDSSYSYSITDITGKTIMESMDQEAKKNSINLSGVSSGMYFLRISSKGENATQKLLVR